MDTPAAILHAVADRFLVNIEPDVIHTLHGGASLVVSESAASLSSAFLHQALLHDLFIQTIRRLLSRQLTPAEVEIVLAVLAAESKDVPYRAGRLGFVESLIRRRWLKRDPDGNIRPGDEARVVVMESSRNSGSAR